MKKLICLSIVFVTFFSCSSDETTETFIDENIDIITTPTQAKAKVFNFNEEPQPGYTVLMFEEQPDIESPLPQILMQGVSDNEG